MNCRHFQDELFEYVEGTLPADAQAAAQKHLAECAVCRQAVEKEKRLGSALSSRLRQFSQPLTLHPKILRNILAASERKGSVPMAESLIDLCKYWLRVAAIPVAMLLVAGVLLAIHSSGTRKREAVADPGPSRISAVTSPAQDNSRTPVSVQMSYHLPRREFRREGNLVVDTLVDETVVVDETVPSGNVKNLPQKLEIKTPL